EERCAWLTPGAPARTAARPRRSATRAAARAAVAATTPATDPEHDEGPAPRGGCRASCRPDVQSKTWAGSETHAHRYPGTPIGCRGIFIEIRPLPEPDRRHVPSRSRSNPSRAAAEPGSAPQ